RIRVMLGFFLAVLAAIGFDNLLRAPRRRSRGALAREIIVGAVGVAGLAFVVYRVQLASRGRTQVSASRYILPLLVAALAVAAVVIASLPQRSKRQAVVRTIALGALPVLVLVESLAWVLPFWARIPVDDFYPT